MILISSIPVIMAEGGQAHLSLLVILQSQWIELIENLLGRFVFMDLAVCIKGDHIGRIDGCRELEELFETLFLRTRDILFCHCDHEVYGGSCVILAVVLS